MRVPEPAADTGSGDCGSAQCPAPDLPGYEVAGVPAGWTRTSHFEGRSYTVQYQQPASTSDRAASVEATPFSINSVAPDAGGTTAAHPLVLRLRDGLAVKALPPTENGTLLAQVALSQCMLN